MLPFAGDSEYARAVLLFEEAVEIFDERVAQRGAGSDAGRAAVSQPLGESDAEVQVAAADLELRAAVSAVELANEILLSAWERQAQGQAKARLLSRAL